MKDPVDDKPGRRERIGLKGRPKTVCFALPVCVTQEKIARISLMVIASALKRTFQWMFFIWLW